MKRYDIDVRPDRSYYGQGERFEAFAYESGQGDWVRQEDVARLLALNAEMFEAMESFLYPDDPNDWQDVLIEQIPRLRTIVTKAKGGTP